MKMWKDVPKALGTGGLDASAAPAPSPAPAPADPGTARVVKLAGSIGGAIGAVIEASSEKPMELTQMVEDMQRTANEGNKFYNFGSMENMLSALDALSPKIIQAIVSFAKKVSGRRTEYSFPVLVDRGDHYLLVESGPSNEGGRGGLHPEAAYNELRLMGLRAPTTEEMGFLISINLHNTFMEWCGEASYMGLNAGSASGDIFGNFEYTGGSASSGTVELAFSINGKIYPASEPDMFKRSPHDPYELCKVRALQVLPKNEL